jgi:tetratricopeptide (TPR) repeat protein
MRSILACCFALGSLLAQQPGSTTQEGRVAPLLKNIGDLHSPITTKSKDAQKFFDQGLTLVYGFNHAEALRSFREVARLDPNCAMAYWGQALALAPNINDSAIGPDREQQGYAAISEAVKRKGRASSREKGLIDALAARFSSAKEPDRQALNEAYAARMTQVHKRYSKDPDVATLYADAVMNTMPWNYWLKDSKPKPGVAEARAALENTLRDHARHPGANHLYIHLIEASDYVDLAVPSADRLGSLVPAAGHLVHMPSHIYIRVGRYGDAVAANMKAITADEDYITQCRAQGIYPAAYYPHNIHFLNAALSMEGRSREALESAIKVASQHSHEMMRDPNFAFAHQLKAVPIQTMVRFGQWDQILNEPEPGEDLLYSRAMRHFARGYALLARGRAVEAAVELDALKEIAGSSALKAMKGFDTNPIEKLAEIGVAMLQAETVLKSGRVDEGIAAYRRAVELEDNLRYNEPPDWPLPPRHYLGDALLSAGRFAEAETVYREDLKRHRNNGWSLYGLAESLRRQAKAAEADEVQKQFAQTWVRADVALSASRF